MKKNSKLYALLCVLILLLSVDIFLVRLDIKHSENLLTFAVLDVGQGDALFIEAPSGAQIMFDMGPARKVLAPLSRVMSPFDRTIDALVITNPDADHIGGGMDILKNYDVNFVFESGTQNSSKTFRNLKSEIQNKKIPDILVRKGMRINLGGGAVIDILFPDQDVSSWSTNDGSVVARLSYGETSIMLTGDATSKTEKIILADTQASEIRSTILKVGHHGSRSSTSYPFVKAVGPVYALISSGKGNTYGHPHQEVLKTLESARVKILRTDQRGTIIVKSDGSMLRWQYER
ncbi:MAG: ComEC/Rec2 family competence protein [Candidatus Paceibacterota bacterium]|jgi:competence protein ComEC